MSYFAKQNLAITLLISCWCLLSSPIFAADNTLVKGKLLYSNTLENDALMQEWVMEGPGKTEFQQSWMQMYSPDEQGHHVLWCPQDFPDAFIAEWQVQNLKFDAGLVIVFFAAKGEAGEDIFDPSLPARDGTFDQYTQGKIKSYHISYYANAAHNPDRAHANLRKNNTFSLLQEGEKGIATLSSAVHQIQLIKQGPHIRMYIDGRKIIDYHDEQAMVSGVDTGPALTDGKIGFRQMQWTRFQYRNFKVWALADS